MLVAVTLVPSSVYQPRKLYPDLVGTGSSPNIWPGVKGRLATEQVPPAGSKVTT